MDYLKSLEALKRTFIGGKDKMVVAEAISQHFNKPSITCLDVGTGDATYINKVADILAVSHLKLDITGIDPLLGNVPTAQFDSKRTKLLAMSFEEYSVSARFDVVQARQSLYYTKDTKAAIGKLTKLTSAGGLLVINLWSERCSLLKLHRRLKGNRRSSALTVEDAFEIVRSNPNVRSARLCYREGFVDFTAWASSDVLCAAYDVIMRTPPGLCRDPRKLDQLHQMIDCVDSPAVRVNGLIFAQV